MRKLSTELADKFLCLNRHLILFTNHKYQIYSKFKQISDIQDLDDIDLKEGISPIQKKMYQKNNIKTFCDENPYDLPEKDLYLISEWQHSFFIEAYIMRHLSTHTVLMSCDEPNRLYGIKGIKSELSDMVPSNTLPIRGNFVLLPFMGQIIYDGFPSFYRVFFGSGMRKNLTDDYNYSKSMNGIYCEYKPGDDLSKPPSTSTIQDQVKYSISQSLKRGEFPRRALEFAESSNAREVFEKEYTKHFIKNDKKNLKNNPEIPKMHYAAYRASIIGVMPTKKELAGFCEKNYKNIVNYITFFSV